MENGMKEQKKVNNFLMKISKDLDIPLVATNDVHYLTKEEVFAHEVLLCIQTQTTIQDANRFRFSSDTFYFRSPQEMKELFRDVPGALRNTLEITQKCNLMLDFSQVHLPKFPLPQSETEGGFLRRVCYENLKERYPQASQDVTDRLEYELKVIKGTGFASYFLIIWDLVKFAKERNIPVGPGRGSAAGSLVSYLLGVTDVDPLAYNLIFERFLNPERISMPDIDIDFCYEKRSEILGYVSARYGTDNVAQVITFGTMLARAVVRDVGRVLGLTYSEVDKIAKMIPYTPGHYLSLKEALATTPELKAIYKQDKRITQLIDVAVQLEGLSRHASTHAAGVVISDRPLIERIPLVRGGDGEVVTGLAMDSLEKTGLLKMDFLGLKTLTVIYEAAKITKRTRDKDIDIRQIPLEDKKTFQLLARGNTVGIFQLESRGMRDLLKRMRPQEFKDLIAVLALYRPGPLGSGMVEDFIDRKRGKKPISYIHPRLEPILKETYGIIVYQEQTMQIASGLAGFTLSQADLLRKAIGKKIPEIMDEQRKLFLDGCKKNGISQAIAIKIFDLIDYFSGYGFNKSHSTAYALISYQTAYLKANYPIEFMAALLTSERNNTDKVVEYVNEAKRMGIDILPPDINESYSNFTVTPDGIRFGLTAIKNVGRAAVESIIAARSEEKFKDLFHLCGKIDSRTVNKKVMESLIKCGAMDSFGLKRAQAVVLADRVMARNSKRSKNDTNQLQLFSLEPAKEEIPEVEEWPLAQILSFEKNLLGFYLTSHPVASYRPMMKHVDVEMIEDISFDEGEALQEKEVTVVGVISKVKLTSTRRTNERMAILKLEDETGGIEVFVFPRLFQEVSYIIKEDNIVALKGTITPKDKVAKIIASKIILVEDILSNVKGLNILVDKNIFKPKELKEVFLEHKGEVPVYFTMKNARLGGVKIKTGQDYYIDLSPNVLEKVSSLVGEKNFLLTL